MLSEVALWIERLAGVIPEFVSLWQAAETKDAKNELDASLTLIRAIKDRQAKETIVQG